MKKKLLIVLVIVVALLVGFVLINQIDVKVLPGIFKVKDIPAASLDKNNGFYGLWTMAEPVGVDIRSDEIIDKYCKLFDPRFKEEYLKSYDYEQQKKMYKPIREKYKTLDLTFRWDIRKKDWCEEILARKEKLHNMVPEVRALFERNKMMVENPVWEDFISIEADAPLPNLLMWLHGMKLSTAVNMLTALEGDWQAGVSGLLDQVDFAKRAVKHSRFLIVNLISKACMQIPLHAITSLMNRKECPKEVYRLVLDRMPPIEYDEYGTRNSLICEFLAFGNHFTEVDKIWGIHYTLLEKFATTFLHQKNRTLNYAYRFYKEFIDLEGTLPYKWKTGKVDLPPLRDGMFWWLWNAGGKVYMKKYEMDSVFGGLYATVFKAYGKKAMYDLVKISAELHLNYDPDKPVQQILEGLESYRSTIDVCSGKPYKWNDEKQLLYGINIDREDNHGETNLYEKIEGTDIALPVILFLK